MISTTRPSLSNLAASASSDRNRAVDFYRVVAMIAVAVGHWAAIAITIKPEAQPGAGREIVAGNALEFAPSMAWITWILQVMPLFFVVGGFASAMSLDANSRRDDENRARRRDWVADRLRRMVAPAVTLAVTWIVAMAAATAVGAGSLAGMGMVAAAIPLWFLANYTIDTALAPLVLPRFRANPGRVAALGLGLFASLETLRFVDLGTALSLPSAVAVVVEQLPQLNWILGWLLFQVAGFAWRDGLLPTGRVLVAGSLGSLAVAIAAVTVGPYPVSMVHIVGIGPLSPTYPPSAALLAFGAGFSGLAIAAAPRVSAWLGSSRPMAIRLWKATVAGGSIAMSVYLWHFTAAVVSATALYALGAAGIDLLPSAEVGTGLWWIQKLPLMGLSALVLGWHRRSRRSGRAGCVVRSPGWVVGKLGVSGRRRRRNLNRYQAVGFWATDDLAAWACLVVGLWYGFLRQPKPRTDRPACT